MQKQTQFQISNVESALVMTKQFFVSQGFKLLEQSDSSVSFTKGSTMQNMVSFNPLNWKSKIVVMIVNDLLTADFDIDTTGQIVTPKEDQLWDTFVEKFKVSILDNVDVSKEISRQLKQTQQNTWRYVGWAFVGGVIGAIPFYILAWITGLEMLAPAGIAAGAVLFMMNRINNDRKKTS